MKRYFWLMLLLPGLGASGQMAGPSASPHGRARQAEPKNAVGWFRRAADATNIRFPGSAAFEMKVTFHAYPGIDFAKKGQSPIMTGDGTYQETWLSPHRWRREVSFGGYHAVEVEADGVRKFQASSDYEPSRVLMLMRALLYPIPRYDLEPELQQIHLHWKLKHRSAGGLDYGHIALHSFESKGEVVSTSAFFDFLPGGALVRSKDIHGLVTSWWEDVAFYSHLVPTHLAVNALGHELVSADVKIESVPKGARITQLPGKRAEPGMTLRPFDYFLDRPSVRTFPDVWPLHYEAPKVPSSETLSEGDQVLVSMVIDRRGMPREVEWTGVEQQSAGHGTRLQMEAAFAASALAMVRAVRRDRFRPPLIDGAPCEVMAQTGIVYRGLVNLN